MVFSRMIIRCFEGIPGCQSAPKMEGEGVAGVNLLRRLDLHCRRLGTVPAISKVFY